MENRLSVVLLVLAALVWMIGCTSMRDHVPLDEPCAELIVDGRGPSATTVVWVKCDDRFVYDNRFVPTALRADVSTPYRIRPGSHLATVKLQVAVNRPDAFASVETALGLLGFVAALCTRTDTGGSVFPGKVPETYDTFEPRTYEVTFQAEAGSKYALDALLGSVDKVTTGTEEQGK